jgi:hypothetical protein
VTEQPTIPHAEKSPESEQQPKQPARRAAPASVSTTVIDPDVLREWVSPWYMLAGPRWPGGFDPDTQWW